MMRNDASLLRSGMKLALRAAPKRALSRILGPQWRAPLLRFSAFGPTVSVLEGETVVLGGCYRFDSVRSFHAAVGPRGRVVAIEANESNVEKLRRQIASDPELGTAKNITLVSKGIWNERGKMTFIASDGEDAALDKIESRQLREFPYHKLDAVKRIEIEVDSLDNILKDVGVDKVDFVLLTINDAELLALDGVEGLMAGNPNVRFLVHSQSPYPSELVKKKLVERGCRVYACPIGRSKLEKIYAFRAGHSHARKAAVA